MPPSWALPLALLFNAAGSALGIYAFISPIAAARMYGIEIEESGRPATGAGASASSSPGRGSALPFVAVFGGRNLAIGTAMMAFWALGMPEALGTLLLCLMVSGAVDTVITARWGRGQSAWTHAVGTAVMGFTGWALLH